MAKKCCCSKNTGCTCTEEVQDLQNQIDNLEDRCLKSVYTWDTSPGVIEELWTGVGNSAPHGELSNIFTGNTHINGAPDISVVVLDWNDNTLNDPSNGTDQGQWAGYIYIENDGTQVQDINPNTGETIKIFVGKGCCAPVVVYERTTNTGAGDVGTGGPFVTLNEGWHKIIFQISDLSAFGGVQLQTDVGGNGVFTNFTGPTSTTLPGMVCRNVDCDYVLVDNEFDCPQSLCAECDPIDIQIPDSEDLDEQTLSSTEVGGVTTAIAISNGNSISVNHPDQEICTGDFVDVTGRAGWLHTWSPIYTANSGTVIDGYAQVSTSEVSPNCVTDITVNVSLGNSYMLLRNMFGRAWYDVRLLINGAAVTTWTFHAYHYDERSDSDNIDDILYPMGSAHFARTNVPAGATITVEIQRRHNFVVRQGTVSTPYGRVISGLRSHFNVHYSPTQIVTGRI